MADSNFWKEVQEDHRYSLIRYLFKKKKSEHENYAPFRVDIVDQFQGHCEDGCGTLNFCNTLEEAIGIARKITEEAIGPNKDAVKGWHGMGQAGLVYDSKGNLAWDGVNEYAYGEEIKSLLEDESNGIKKMLEAIDFAANAHAGYFRKGTKIPYIVHPLGVTTILYHYKCLPYIISAAVLHDTVEDPNVTIDQIYSLFGNQVAEIVKNVSEPDKNDTWENRKKHTIESLKYATVDTLLVACADKLDNMRAIHKDYSEEKESFWSRFKRSKESQKWYYQALVEVLAKRKENEVIAKLVESLAREVQVVFS